jgi:hypothetical protein
MNTQPPTHAVSVTFADSRDAVRLLSALSHAVSDDPARAPLGVVAVRRFGTNKAECCSTDGHRLALVTASCGVVVDTLDERATYAIARPAQALVLAKAARAGLVRPARAVPFVLEVVRDTTFPDYTVVLESVCGRDESDPAARPAHATLNPRYLADAARACETWADRKRPCVRVILGHTEYAPTELRAEDAAGNVIRCLIMPMRA